MAITHEQIAKEVAALVKEGIDLLMAETRTAQGQQPITKRKEKKASGASDQESNPEAPRPGPHLTRFLSQLPISRGTHVRCRWSS